MSMLTTLIDRLARMLFILGVLAGILMTVLIFTSTLLRYLIGHPIGFSDELAGLMFVTLAFTTIPHVLNQNRHIGLDLFTGMLSHTAQLYVQWLAALIFIAFALILAWESWQFMTFSHQISARSDISGLLLWPWMAIMPFSMVLTILIQLKNTFNQSTRETPL
ncbi:MULTISPECIES: TRAP transporter small permease [Marinobacterium]|uniref:TRAP transporter small permease n=1 Tax=Marinobacterium TaxID=48075 RepID=UPI000836988B|nr:MULTISPECIES: TRAP transporter small permease [Marinobacterium]MCP8687196.1 TRAP transporter small permease [Marinobacterium sedimentorum]